MNVLVIAPHPDDEAIGCGGTVCKHSRNGDRVTVVFLTSGELGLKHLPREKAWTIREREAKAAARILGVAQVHFLHQPDWMLGRNMKAAARALRPLLSKTRPGLIYAPHEADGHPDHQAALSALRLASRGWRGARPEVRAYEVWTPLTAHDHVEDISRVMPRKLRALRAHASQMGEFDYVRAVRGLNAFRGQLAAKCRYAEVFQSVPWEERVQ
jgi:LmbE family N-acetylglucosaminyl deacetylase